MTGLQSRIEALYKTAETWLSDDNEHTLRAVHQTVEEGYFNFEDIQFALKSLKESFTKQALEEWVKRSGITNENDARGKNVLCLHAGNLPLVGFQDALAVLLSGARYTGKISRKDPYLLPTFLNEVKQTEIWGGVDVQWTHRLDDFEGMQIDRVLFAGSEQSVPGVKQAIKKYNLEKKNTEYLIRTAHFSMAYVDQMDERTLQAMGQAILRYGGTGCRSVAVVVSPFPFDSVKAELKDCLQNILDENPQHHKPMPKLRQRYAYNKAVGRDQIWLNDFLVQEGGLELDQDFICYWVEGDEEKVETLAASFGKQLQSVYVSDSESAILGCETELLAVAQQPPIYWTPDGTDTLNWLSG